MLHDTSTVLGSGDKQTILMWAFYLEISELRGNELHATYAEVEEDNNEP